jgi:S1-C subfamily serine protease
VTASFLLTLGVAIGVAIALLAVRPPGTPVAAAPLASPTQPDHLARSSADGADSSAEAPAAAPAEPTEPATRSSEPAANDALSVEDLVSAALPAVASIDTGAGRGSGFFVRPDLVVTNAHVVDGHASVRLRAGGVEYTARPIATSPGSDLSLLQVYGANAEQAVLRLGTAADARPGEEVIAIGYALGSLSNTVTRGIVSAIRQAGAVTLLQTDAAINPGNSGGPLLDRQGRVIGVNSMAVARQTGEGLGFAIAVDHVTQLLAGHPPPSLTTPLAGLTQALGGPSETDLRRSQDLSELESVFAWADRNSAPIDDSWAQVASVCVSSTSRAAASRPWFALWDSAGVQPSVANGYDCPSWLATVRRNALRVHDALVAAAEAARRRGIFPGVVRDLRRKYRLEWEGWDR